MKKNVALWLLSCVLCAVPLACGETGGSGNGGAGGEGAGDSGARAGATTTTTPPIPDKNHCAKACQTPADCCNGVANCPSDTYPHNYECVSGACRAECASDADCMILGAPFRCAGLYGYRTCVLSCTSDAGCNAAQPCSGVSDEGITFCGCTADAYCVDATSCDVDRGICTCTSDSQCTSSPYTHCMPFK